MKAFYTASGAAILGSAESGTDVIHHKRILTEEDVLSLVQYEKAKISSAVVVEANMVHMMVSFLQTYQIGNAFCTIVIIVV